MSDPLLAIECSQRRGGVALRDGSGDVHVHRFDDDVRHGDVLLPAIEGLCSSAGVARRDLCGCGVSIGPGGFTGLRVSIATARSMAWSLGIPVYGVPSALVVAASMEATESTAVVGLSGKGTDAWLTGVRHEDGRWRIDRDGTLVDESALNDWFDGKGVLLADEHLPAGMRSAADSAGWAIREPQWDPGACLELALQRHAGDASDDVHGLLPPYPRVPEAVSLWEARKRG